MHFHELMFETLKISKIPVSDVDDIGDAVDLEVDGVIFILKNGSTEDEDALEYLCDFGEPPAAHRNEVLTQMLEINSLMPMLNPPIFALDMDNGHAILRGRQGIAGMEPLALLNVLASMASQAKVWKAAYEMPDHDPGRAQPARGSVERWMVKESNEQKGA